MMMNHSRGVQTSLDQLLLDEDDLLRLPELEREYARKQEDGLKEFQNVSRQQRRASEAALRSLKTARGGLAKLSTLLAELAEIDDGSSGSSASSTSSYDSQLLRKLATVHSNIHETYRSAESVSGLPEAATRAEAMLEEMNLVEAHVYLSQVEATVYRIKSALADLNETNKANKTRQRNPTDGEMVTSLEPYFDRVHASMRKIEHRLWWIVRSFMETELDRRLLVEALRVIETQELVDSKLVAEGLGDCQLRKGWRHRCMQNMSNAISEKTIHVLQRCSKIRAGNVTGENGEGDEVAFHHVPLGEALRDVLGEAGRILRGMAVAVERVHGCFPERYRIREFVRKESRAFKESVLEILGGYSEDMSNGDILFVLDWAEETRGDRRPVGGAMGDGDERGTDGDNSEDSEDSEDDHVCRVFTNQYLNRMDRALRNWLRNILMADFEGSLKSDKKGMLFTPGPQDMFRLIEEQERFVSENAVMRVGVRRQISAILKEYLIEEYRRRIGVEENLEVLCAVCNNLIVLDDLLSEYKLEGLKQCARDAAMRCGRVIYLDPGFAQLFEGFFSDDEGWKKAGTRTGSLMATLEDFMVDFRVWLGPNSDMGDICMREIVDGCCRYYVACLLSSLSVIDSATIDRMDDDLSRMRDKFMSSSSSSMTSSPSSRVSEPIGLVVIEGIREFFSSDSVESFVIGWLSIVNSGGLGGPALGLLQGLVHKRVDLTRSDCREILAALHELATTTTTNTSCRNTPDNYFEGVVAIQEANEGLRHDAQFSAAWRGLRW